MTFLLWIVFGLIVGVVANAVDPRPQEGGMLGAIVLGILGAVVGGFLSNLIFGVGVTGFNLSSFIVAILGAVLLLGVGRAMRRA